MTERRDDLARITEERMAIERAIAIRDAPDDLIKFAKLLRPHPKFPGDVSQSRYSVGPLHRALGNAANRISKGQVKRLIINVPPRHGKTELMSKIFPAHFVGQDAYRSVIVATYNDTFAEEFGKAVRTNMQSNAFAQIFPDCRLAKGSASSDRLQTEEGGQLSFVGINGTLTGRGGDLLIVDDPLKGSEEARSAATREKLWKWFNADLMSRFMTDEGVILLIQTRWHDDDLVGRLTDPANPHYNEEEAALWDIINIPAIAEADDPLGRTVGEALWPARFGIEYLKSARRRDPVMFSALYQQRPSPEDGDFFTSDMIEEYIRHQLPPAEELRYYISVDMAVAQKQRNDKSVILVSAVDAYDNIYLIECEWGRLDTLQAVDKLIELIKKYKPMTVYGEKDHIFKSIGPFLYKRMRDERLFTTTLEELPTHIDKLKKAQPIKARMQMKTVKFPKNAIWYGDARRELLKFPNGTHDDFVDALANIGRALNEMLAGKKPSSDTEADEIYLGPKPGTFAYMKAQSQHAERTLNFETKRADW